MKKIIQISDEHFWGYNIEIDLDNYSSYNELSILLKKELIKFLKRNNLLNLVDMAENLKLHNHSYIKYNDLYKSGEDIIYFCGGCCERNL